MRSVQANGRAYSELAHDPTAQPREAARSSLARTQSVTSTSRGSRRNHACWMIVRSRRAVVGSEKREFSASTSWTPDYAFQVVERMCS
jgi:hypothetical protein